MSSVMPPQRDPCLKPVYLGSLVFSVERVDIADENTGQRNDQYQLDLEETQHDLR